MADLLGREIKFRIEKYLTTPPFQSRTTLARILSRIETDFPRKAHRLRPKLGAVFADLEIFYSILFDRSFVTDARTRTILVATLVFFLNPFEFLRKGIPLVGLVDDRLVIACAAQLCRDEIDRFQAREEKGSG